jgi:hypothetical protein
VLQRQRNHDAFSVPASQLQHPLDPDPPSYSAKSPYGPYQVRIGGRPLQARGLRCLREPRGIVARYRMRRMPNSEVMKRGSAFKW